MSADKSGALAKAVLMRELQSISASLSADGDVHRSIHTARKAIRRTRALLALFSEGAMALQDEDRALQRLGRGLSRLRDAHVAVELALELHGAHGDATSNGVVIRLITRREAILGRILAADPGFTRRRQSVEHVRALLQEKPWDTLQRSQVRASLSRSLRRVVRAEVLARNGEPEAVHRWRRRVRRLRMQLEIGPELGGLWKTQPKDRSLVRRLKTLHRLSDRLGLAQDLGLLRNLVRTMPASQAKQALLAEIGARLGVDSA